MGREHVGQVLPCAGGGAEQTKGPPGQRHLRKNSASGSWVGGGSAVWKNLRSCIQK